MTRTMWTTAVAVLLAASLASGQDGSARISGPVLGYVLDGEAAGVRPIFGLPGAATLGPLLDLGGEIHRAAIAQQMDYLLAAIGPERRVTLLRNLAGEVSSTPVAEAVPAPDRILLSPAGSAAALLYADRGLVQVVAGLPDAPAVSRTLELASLPAGAKVWAVSDDGNSLLLSAATGDSEGLYLFDAEGNLRLLLPTGEASAAVFLGAGTEVVLADSLRNAVYRVSAEGEVTLLAGERDGISKPTAVSVSRDRSRVFVVNEGSGTIAALDLTGGPPSLVSCDCALTRLEPLQGNAVFRLTDLSGEPMWLLDGGAPEARVVFVPARRPVEGEAK